eukprot:c36332_g1_i1 orf=10-303(+)
MLMHLMFVWTGLGVPFKILSKGYFYCDWFEKIFLFPFKQKLHLDQYSLKKGKSIHVILTERYYIVPKWAISSYKGKEEKAKSWNSKGSSANANFWLK